MGRGAGDSFCFKRISGWFGGCGKENGKSGKIHNVIITISRLELL